MAWMIRSWAGGRMSPLEVIAERESIFTVLSQTTPDRLHKNYHQYSIDPNTRYPNLSTTCVKPRQVVHLYDGVVDPKELEEGPSEVPAKRARNVVSNEYNVDSYNLLRWCQRVLNTGIYRGVHIVDFTSSWRSGLAFCALIHAFKPTLVNVNSLMECETVKNNQLAFDTAQKELGIAPVMTGEDMASCAVPDKLTMVAYLSQYYELFKHEPLPSTIPLRPKPKEEKPKMPRSPNRKVSLLSKIGSRINRSKKRKDKEDGEEAQLGSKKLRDGQHQAVELMKYNKLPMEEIANRLQVDPLGTAPAAAAGQRRDKQPPGDTGSVSVTAMAEVLVAKFRSNEDQGAPPPVRRMKGQPVLLAAQHGSEFCYFCEKRVYIMERQATEGVFFHRHCLKCDYCGVGLRLNNYSCERPLEGGVKFYCYRHFNPESRIRPRRKRNLDAAEDSKENIPTTVITPAEETEAQLKNGQATPKKHIPAPLQVPDEPLEKASKTPERIEFEISFDGQEEETEEEQFEHNLRASMSSDTILDNSDDDEEEDESDESGAEDDLFETGKDSLSAGDSHSLTWDEAVRLASTWKRQHSKEDLLEAVEMEGEKRRHPSRDAYERLHNGRGVEDDEDDEDEEGSSTEVEEDSEYETGDSSADEATEEESERTRGGGESTADTLENSTTATTTSPSSPAVKSQSGRASFFSQPPQVVRLDHWRMFNKDKKGEEAAEGEGGAENAGGVVEEGGVDVDEENRDTDVSESLEMDSGDEEGSVEDLEEEEEGECAMSEGEERNEEEEMEEVKDKMAVSLAMEQLMVDIDKTSVGGLSDNAAELENLLEDDNSDIFQTGVTTLPETESERVREGEGEKMRSPSEDTTESVMRSIRDMDDTNTMTSGEDTLRQVLEDVAAMPDLSDSEEAKLEPFKNMDERFITDRKKLRKKRGEGAEEMGSGSDITISTPSDSCSSSSSSLSDVIQYNEQFLEPGDGEEDVKPDEDMMQDYMTTMSLALDESYSDAERDGSFLENSNSSLKDEMNSTLQAEDTENKDKSQDPDDSRGTNASSVYLTPEVSMEERRTSQDEFKDAQTSPPAAVAGASPGAAKATTPDSHKPSTKVTKVSDVKPKIPKDAISKDAPKGFRKLPEVPKPKISLSQPQNTKKTAPTTKKVSPSNTSNKLSAPKPTKTSTARTKLASSSSASDSSKQRATSSESSRQRATSSAASSDSSRASVPRALPRPGMAKRVTPTSTSSDRSSVSPARVSSAASKTTASVSDTGQGEGAKGKTVIPVDKESIWSDSSTDQQASDSELRRKKKIPVDASVRDLPVPHKPSVVSDIDDIPFADESEVDEKFHTPATSVKPKPEPAPQPDSRNNVRKRVLPSPPSVNPSLPSVEQIQNIRQAEQARAKQIAGDKTWPKPEEEVSKGAAFVNPGFGSPLKRKPGMRLTDDPRDRRSSSYDTPGTPDILSDSDDYRQQTTATSNTPTSSANELDPTSPKDKKKKSKEKTPKSTTASAAKVKMRKSKDFVNKRKSEEKSQGEEAKKEKNRRSFLAMLLPKSTDKTKEKLGSAAAASDMEHAMLEKHKSPKPHAEDKHKKSKGKHKRTKSKDSLDDNLTSDIKGLKITSVFDKELGQGDGERQHHGINRPIPIAPKASVDEFSDSDESIVSVNTLMRRKDQLSTEGLDDRVARKLKRMAVRQHKQAEQQRLRAAQEIQRRLQEVDERQRELEDRGIAVEKALRGDGPEADVEESQLMGEWFNLVHEKNALVRYESELMVKAKELELEDRQERLQSAFRDCSAKPDTKKTPDEIEDEGHLLDELLDVVEQRNSLVAMLEEDRLREQQEDRELENMMVKKGFVLSPLNYARSIPPANLEPPVPPT
ncbi:protein-methionine sulfoxide oxidase mical3a-like [Littorina saxatilis]|uniref:protein-methionine sulfoxide oxidase mical3a-like n=1 Tax=Littorina saxatilis TaxID=31220 RepID=UPI0038B6900A